MATEKTTPALEAFRETLADPHKVAKQWKAGGGKVVGYRCLYVPEEVIWAAEMLPFPLYGTPEAVRLADAYFQPCTCEFVRNLFDHALEGRYDYLDCLALSNTCDVVRRLHDLWDGYIKGTPVYMLNNPQKLGTETNRGFFVEELRRFRVRMEELSGKAITDDGLREATKIHNERRSLLRQISMLRQQDQPPIKGSEFLEVCLAAALLPAPKANILLRQLLEEIDGREIDNADGPRILVTGSIVDHPALIQMIEEEGGVVVADDLCTTSRYFWYSVDEEGDPMEALYRYMNKRPLCACMHPQEPRLQFVEDMADELEVEGVVNFNLKYCHPFAYEAPILKRRLEGAELPTTVLEVGHDTSGHGQLRTRIQAFIEMLEA